MTHSCLITGNHLADVVLRYGRGAVGELVVVRGGSSRGLARVVKLAERSRVPVRWVDADAMRRLTGEASADIALTLAERKPTVVDDVLPPAPDPALLLVLEGVEDPHNVGEILRTAWAADVHVVVLEHHAAAMPRDLLARSSAGASECLPLVFSANLPATLRSLRRFSVETLAASPEADERLFDVEFPDRVAVVVGGEHRGLSRAVASACARHVTVPTAREVQSLSASSSAAVMLFEMVRRRGGGAT